MFKHSSATLVVATVCLASPWCPAAEATRYALDSSKSTLVYGFVQAGAKNQGKFAHFAVSLEFSAENVAASHLSVNVDVKSLNTGDAQRDEALRSDDFFAVQKYPQATFTATQIAQTASGFDAVGKLTIRGVTRDVHVPFSFRTASEQGHNVGYLAGTLSLRRLDFGLGQGEWKSTEWIANEVSVTYSLRLQPAT
jgi:polyisoprenoid-binding protein YceI